MKLKAILIDDERSSLANLSYNISAYFKEQIEIVAQTTDPFKGLELIKTHQPDILFLDIKMPKLDGFQLLEKIPEKAFFLIFTTAYSNYGVRAIKASAFDYLLKPIDPLELKATVERIIQIISLQNNKTNGLRGMKHALNLLMKNIKSKTYPSQIIVPYQDGSKTIIVDDILYIIADVNYSVIHIKNQGRLIVSRTLKSFEELLDVNQFFRIHKSYLVNSKYVTQVVKKEQHCVKLEGGEELPIARRRTKAILDKLGTK